MWGVHRVEKGVKNPEKGYTMFGSSRDDRVMQRIECIGDTPLV